MINLKVKKMYDDATLPQYSLQGDAALDLTAYSVTMERSNNYVIYGTGLAIELPMRHVGLIFPRSSICKRDLSLANSVGVIDPNYRGELQVRFYLNQNSIVYNVGQRIAQLLILPYPHVNVKVVDNLSTTNREGGFGSTGD